MYHVTVSDNKRIITGALREGLADAVAYGRKKGQKGNRITVFDSLQDATGGIVHLSKVLSMILHDEDHKEYLKS